MNRVTPKLKTLMSWTLKSEKTTHGMGKFFLVSNFNLGLVARIKKQTQILLTLGTTEI